MSGPKPAAAEAEHRLTYGGRPSIYPWRTVEIGGEFTVPASDKATKYVSRDAASYYRKYGLRFTCRKTGTGTIVRRVE